MEEPNELGIDYDNINVLPDGSTGLNDYLAGAGNPAPPGWAVDPFAHPYEEDGFHLNNTLIATKQEARIERLARRLVGLR